MALAALYFVCLVVAAAGSVPRRVGDGGEYMAMALQLASARPPSVSPAEMDALKAQLAAIGGGFESSLLDYPNLVSTDGRQDFLHFFAYPLIVAPVLAGFTAMGAHPNWAFTLVNALVLTAALFLVSRSVPLIVAVAAFLGPVVWWVDKAHTEAFLYASVAVAAVMLHHRPIVAVIAFAVAGAQNAALGATYPVFAVVVLVALAFRRRVVVAALIGTVIVGLPFLYNLVRLGRLSPMAEYAELASPSLTGLAAFIFEPNIGLLPYSPVYGMALGCALWLLLVRLRGPSLAVIPRVWWWPGLIQILLMLAWSQNPNANHGGTPGMNRWVLSLLALSIPWLAAGWPILPRGGRIVFNIVVAVSAVMSAAAHLPSRPESYLTPTPLAERLWRAGWVHITPAEVFAERAQQREPAFVPAHDGTCLVLLIANQQAPLQCAPPIAPLPASCRAPGAMCFALSDGERTRYVAAPQNGFFHRAAEPSWPAGGPLAAGVQRVMKEADPNARVWRVDNPRRWQERMPGADIVAVVSTPNVSVIHIARMTADAHRELRADKYVRMVPLMPSSSSGEAPLGNVAAIVRRER